MIDSHRRDDDKPMEQHLHRRTTREMFPTLSNMNMDYVSAILSLILVLLPGILIKLTSFSADAYKQPNPFLTAPGFVNATLLAGFVLAVYALARSKNDVAVRTISILTLIVCIVRFILPS
jgi:hypothetical protein